jgi:hypothetical protein
MLNLHTSESNSVLVLAGGLLPSAGASRLYLIRCVEGAEGRGWPVNCQEKKDRDDR